MIWPWDKIASVQYEKRILTITYRSGKVRQYHGEGTVWYRMPHFLRAGTNTEYWLAGIYTKLQYENSLKNNR